LPYLVINSNFVSTSVCKEHSISTLTEDLGGMII